MKNFFARMGEKLRHFMMGRYGTDKLNSAILIAGLVCCILAIFLPMPIDLLMTLLSYGAIGIVLFRSLSRNTYKRYQENRKYLLMIDRIKDREHKYFDCPRCHQPVRVPRGKGKISITCPKCKEKFIRKS